MKIIDGESLEIYQKTSMMEFPSVKLQHFHCSECSFKELTTYSFWNMSQELAVLKNNTLSKIYMRPVS